MKFTVSVILSALVAFSLGLYLPWWTVAVSGFAVGMVIPQARLLAFLSSFMGVVLLWTVIAFLLSTANNHLLTHRIALLVLKKDNPNVLILLTGLLGGFTAGIAAFAGRSLVLIFKKS